MPRRNTGLNNFIAFAASLGLAAAHAAAVNPTIAREGVGTRRAALDTMELTPFDQGLWSGLTDWENGEPVDAAATRGKVVLVYTFSGYLPTAVRPISIVNRLADRYGKDGFMVVGVHTDEAYAEGVETAKKRRVKFPIARDAGNAFRDAMQVDQDPDFYVIDRSGRLRFADIETGSLERAVSMLIDESSADAEGLLDRMAAADARSAEEARRTARLRSRIDLSDLPWVGFQNPSPAEYAAVDWPEIDTDSQNNSRRRRNAPTGPTKIDLNADLDWQPGKPSNTQGRAVLIYLFSDKVLEDFNRFGVTPVALFGGMNQIQAANPRDLLVVGAMMPSVIENSRGRRNSNNNDAENRRKEAEEVFQTLVTDLPVNHVRVNDYAGSWIVSKLTPNNGNIPGRRTSRGQQEYVYPYHVLVSSDGTVRWHGAVTTSIERSAEWEAALKSVLANDPGIQARRAAEQEYIKSKTE